ncbi:MAG TPA: EAL domain-containing protein [Telluria sp.]|nr:EAL domain-containing protein [Telluria sp.]
MEVSALIAALQANVEQLEQLTGGEIDAIMDQQGRPFLLQRAQQHMRMNETMRQNAMLNALPAYIAMLDAHGVIMSVNDAWRGCSGMAAAQAPGHEVGSNYLQLCEHDGGAADAHAIAAGIRAVLRGAAPACSLEYSCMSHGAHAWFLVTVTPLEVGSRQGAVIMHMDISERKRGEEDLRRFRTAMDCTADAIFLVRRASMRFIEVNATACTMLGYSREELLQLGPVPISTAEPAEHAALYDALIVKGTNEHSESQLRRKDGSWLQVEVHRQALRSGPDWIIVGVVRDITERRQAQKMLQHQAHHDGLTGLPNRTLFYDILDKMLAQAVPNGWMLAVLFIDLDHFKNVNDTLGHSVGDELLIQFSNRLLDCVRVRDTVGRLGGDEFAVVVLMQNGQNIAVVVANKIREVLSVPFTLGGHEINVTASIGITMYPNDASSLEDLIKYADTAMYRAKHAGRDTFRFFTAQMNADVQSRLELEIALRKAFENEEFVLHYQPKIQVSTGRVIGVEALLRWERPGCGLVSPACFIPVLEETGLIVRMGSWVIGAACRQMALWLRSAVGAVSVSVNVAGRQFSEGDLEADVVCALDASGVPPELLELELTEGSLMANTERTITTLKNLKRLGVQISIDDFGTGYSSLAYLRRFPIDKLKIDIAFIREVTTNPDDAAIVIAILGMAHSLNLQVIAEGVETASQLAFLRRHHCDQIQGYFFSRPLALAELEQLLRDDLRLQLPVQAGRRKTLLLVDDEPSVLSSLQRLLRHDGYHILCADSAAAGFELLAQYDVQVIVCDQRMPNMSGTEFLGRVKEMYPDTFRIVLSGYTDLESIMQAVNKGAIYRFYTKPWDNKVLRKELRAAFKHYCLLHDIALAGDDTSPAAVPSMEDVVSTT